MSVLELKNDLHRLVVTTEDEVILENVRAYFLNLTSHEDWWDKLPDVQQQLVNDSIKQLDNGQTSTHQAVRERISKLLNK
jgi:hypothetical protein